MTRRRPLGLNVAANAVTSASVILTALISVPLMLDDVGLAGYGVWTLAQTMILWTTTAEAGFGPAVQRFVAVGQGGGAEREIRRLLWSTCFAYGAVGLLVAALGVVVAPALVDVFDVPAGLHDDAVAMFRIMAGVIWIALLAAGLGNVQQGLERFGALAVSASAGSVVFLAAVVVVLAAGLGLPGLAIAAALQQVVMLLVRFVDLRSHFRPPIELVHRRQAYEIGGFSLRLQMTTLSTLVNSQTDKVIVGLVATAPVLGQLGIGAQVAEAGRLVAGAALSPIVSRLAITHGAGDAIGFRELFERLHRLWVLLVIGGTVMGAAVLYPLIAGWLGDGHGQAAAFGAALVVAYGLSLLTGTPVAYLRALGRPSLEARLGAVLICCNVVLTVALGVAFGAAGVVIATTVTYVLGTAWFFHAFHRMEADDVGRLPFALIARAVLVAAVAGAAAFGWGTLMVALLPAGVALVGVLLGALGAVAAYLALAAGISPTPAGLRRLVLEGAT
jgi:O-antigen/teichoic acid export membrane protein